MKLEDIGFYTLSDHRAQKSSMFSPLQRCELVLTDKCNFKCPYCRGLEKQYQGEISLSQAKDIVSKWTDEGLSNIRFSGGEPTLWPNILKIISFCKEKRIKRIAISTNGSAPQELYKKLVQKGVNDFSISLDACCSSTASIMSGTSGTYSKVLYNIAFLSKMTYVTLGVVLTKQNIAEFSKIIEQGKSLGVADIRIIPAAQFSNKIIDTINSNTNMPILNYRLSNIQIGKTVRGLERTDNRHCPLVLDDMAIVSDYHLPCIIYLREKGKPIGSIKNKTIKEIRKERAAWAENHDCFQDPICRKNCLDVCRQYNNKWLDFHLQEVVLPWRNPESFDWLSWRNGSVRDLSIASRWLDITSLSGKEKLRKYAIGWCLSDNLQCRPKKNQVAVMFQKENDPFWFHMWKNEFYEVFKN